MDGAHRGFARVGGGGHECPGGALMPPLWVGDALPQRARVLHLMFNSIRLNLGKVAKLSFADRCEVREARATRAFPILRFSVGTSM